MIVRTMLKLAETKHQHKPALAAVILAMLSFGLMVCSTSIAFAQTAGTCSESVFLTPISLYGGDGAGLAVDQDGNLFVAENVHPSIAGGPSVSKVTPQGVKTPVTALQGVLLDVTALAVDDSGDLFVADGNGIGNGQPSPNNAVWKVDSQGNLVGGGQPPFASVANPTGIAFDPNTTNVYVASFADNAVYKFSPGGEPLGAAVKELPDAPYGIAFDSSGNLYIAGFGNPANGTRIFKLTPQGVLTTFFDGASQGLTSPHSLVIDKQNNLYASYYNGLKIVRIPIPQKDTPPNVSSTTVFPGGCVADDAANGLAIGDEVFLYTAVNGGRPASKDPAILKLQGIVPPSSECHGQLVAIYVQRYGGLRNAAAALGFQDNVPGLQSYIKSLCGR